MVDRIKLHQVGCEDSSILFFEHQLAWEDWLSRNHSECRCVWLRFAKKRPKVRAMTYVEALESAICFGWIDGQKESGERQSLVAEIYPGASEACGRRSTARRQRDCWSADG